MREPTPPDNAPLGLKLLINQSWKGELSLSDAESMQRFNDYVNRKPRPR